MYGVGKKDAVERGATEVGVNWRRGRGKRRRVGGGGGARGTRSATAEGAATVARPTGTSSSLETGGGSGKWGGAKVEGERGSASRVGEGTTEAGGGVEGGVGRGVVAGAVGRGGVGFVEGVVIDGDPRVVRVDGVRQR